MQKSAWRDVIPWSDVAVPAQLDAAWVSGLKHRLTARRSDEMGSRSGVSVWESEWQGDKLAIAWGWVVRGRAVIALADPMRIASNAALVWSDGEPLSESASVVQLNTIVHGLDWQSCVERECLTRRSLHRPAAVRHSDRRYA